MVHGALDELSCVDVTNAPGKTATELNKYKLVVEAHGGGL